MHCRIYEPQAILQQLITVWSLMLSSENRIPLITKTAFSCPHCGAYTTQHWFNLFADACSDDQRLPFIPDLKMMDQFRSDRDLSPEDRAPLIEWCSNMLSGKPFFDTGAKNLYNKPMVSNCYISKCYNCHDISVWIHDQIVYPENKIDILPNIDLPEHIKELFNEARQIVTLSPKGAAALLRLCVQHLCKELGESGKNIDKDIASLVSKGLNPLVQKALDIVRVIGNEAVHPGEINLNDNKEIAIKLFSLINLISEQMISQPRQIGELYDGLPAGKLDGIAKRDTRE